jgi:uncharacterized protein (DUF2147 family)
MKKMKLSLFLILAIVIGTTAQSKPDAVVGLWLTQNKEAIIEIYKSPTNHYFGKIVKSKKGFYEADGKTLRKDTKNEDVNLRKRTIKDLVILSDFKYSDGIWSNGTIYDGNNGKTYSCKMKLKQDKLEIRGYIGISLFGRTDIWTRTTIAGL